MKITNSKALEQYLETKDKRFQSYERIMKALGFNFRPPSEAEKKVIDKWFDEWNFDLDIILKACENTKKTSNPSISYIDGILSSWYNKGIKNVDEIIEKDKPKVNQKSTSQNRVTTKFHNFEQRTSKYTPDELDKIVRKIFEEKTNKTNSD